MNQKEILPKDIWDDKKLLSINKFVKEHSNKQSKENKIKFKLLAIQYKLEDYLEKGDVKENEILSLLDFVKMYIEALNITKKDLAAYFGMEDSNLHKYLTGHRKLNPEIVLKISAFSNTNPEYWYRVQIKNELLKLKKSKIRDYEKYHYKNLIAVS